MKELLKKKYMEYKDIKSELVTVANDYIYIDCAYVENRTVYIQGSIKPNFNGDKTFDFIPVKYRPRISVYGYVSIVSSGNDNNKVLNVCINKTGTFYLWVNTNLIYYVPFTFIYPLKDS